MHSEGCGFDGEMSITFENLEGTSKRMTCIIIQGAINMGYQSNCGSLHTFHSKIPTLHTAALPSVPPTTFSYSLDTREIFSKFRC